MDQTSATAQKVAAQLTEQGAVMMQPGIPIRRYLIGAWRWLDETTVAWFTAHGDSETDAHALHFDDVRLVENHGVCFLLAGNVVGYLTSITHSLVEDPDDYRIGWQIWREVAPLHRAIVERALGQLIDGEPFPDPPSNSRNRWQHIPAGARTRMNEPVPVAAATHFVE